MASGGDPVGGDGGLALIQKALGDERARSDQHKQNYEHIKSQLAQVGVDHRAKELPVSEKVQQLFSKLTYI